MFPPSETMLRSKKRRLLRLLFLLRHWPPLALLNLIIVAAGSVHDAFLEVLAEQNRKTKPGHGVRNGVVEGPVVNENVRFETRRLIEDALYCGAGFIVRRFSARRAQLLTGAPFFNPTWFMAWMNRRMTVP